MEIREVQEPAQVSILETSHEKLQALAQEGYFSEMRWAYKFAVALALDRGARPVRGDGPRTTLYSVSTLDPDGTLKLAVDTLYDRGSEPAFKVVERLAEWGIDEMHRLLRVEHAKLEDLLE